MKIKQDGIIKQIIPGEKAKQYGFYKYDNCDYLNIRPAEEKEIPAIFKWVFYGLMAGIILISLFVKPGKMMMATAVIVVIVFYVGFRLKEKSRNLPKKYWYLESPVPIEKPYEFKPNDKIKINIDIEKEE